MTTDPKTPAQRLARVFRILAVLAEREVTHRFATDALYWSREAIGNMRSKLPFKHCIRNAERLLKDACRAAGIDPETIQ